MAQRLRETPAATAPEVTFTAAGSDGALAAQYQGAWLSSRHRPLDEAERLAAGVDIVEHTVIAVCGFGLGYHVRKLCERLSGTGIVVVFEPDLALLRAVLERIDHSGWIEASIVIFFSDAEDRAELTRRLDGAQALITQGTTMLEHPPSRKRLGDRSAAFAKIFAEIVASMRTTIMTTLVHSVTTCRNLSLNLDHYGAGEGIAPLHGWGRGHAAILVAAGPSLSRNLHLLEDAAVRERFVIITAQTALKPLLERGIRPHFVTALDYHEISRQFYEGLSADDVKGVTLVCEPKVNRAVVDAWPGATRMLGSDFLDKLLGPLQRDMPRLRPGATVAHLSFYLAQHLGCDPIAFIGQDLGFTDGLYYGPGAAIHEQWAVELNPFNTLDMMEWQRVARMKRTLRTLTDQRRRVIHVDDQMSTYLQQFERDFGEAPERVIDATEGGTLKKNAEVRTLAGVLDEFGSVEPLPAQPASPLELDRSRLRSIRERIVDVKRRVHRLGQLSRSTASILDRMLEDQDDAAAMDRHFDQVDRNREEVEALPDAFSLVNNLNQLGAFNRLRADRRLKLAHDLDERERQRRQIERDRTNVAWIGDAADEFLKILQESEIILGGGSVDPRISQRLAESATGPATADVEATSRRDPKRIAAMIAVDPERGSLRLPRRLDERIRGRSVLQLTLERLSRCETIEMIVLISSSRAAVERLIDRGRISKRIEMRESPRVFDEEHSVIAAARRWSDSCWRGGIGGASIFDEIVAPGSMLEAMESLRLDAALVIGADWPLVDPSAETGCDALVKRYHEHPSGHDLVFTQAPPGLVGCVISRSYMKQLAARLRPAMIGASLSYVPQAPTTDPITKEVCVKLPLSIRGRRARLIADNPERVARLRRVFERCSEDVLRLDATAILDEYERTRRSESLDCDSLPPHITIELTTRRSVAGPVTLHKRSSGLERGDMEIETALRLIEQIANRKDAAITFGGVGDPMLHPGFFDILKASRANGITAVNIRTDLRCDVAAIDRLISTPPDVITVLLNADREETYRRSMGAADYRRVIGNLERLINARAASAGSLAYLAPPWIVPSLVRCEHTLDDLHSFFDRWIYFVGAALIEPWPEATSRDGSAAELDEDPLIHLTRPALVEHAERESVLFIDASGKALQSERDWLSRERIGDAAVESMECVWRRALERRFGVASQCDEAGGETPFEALAAR